MIGCVIDVHPIILVEELFVSNVKMHVKIVLVNTVTNIKTKDVLEVAVAVVAEVGKTNHVSQITI